MGVYWNVEFLLEFITLTLDARDLIHKTSARFNGSVKPPLWFAPYSRSNRIIAHPQNTSVKDQ